ncbi:MAG: glycosyltransferase family 2 protein [Caldilineaceae bacterium]
MNQLSAGLGYMPEPIRAAKVTIIVLTWNSLRHVDSCLSSLLQQSYRDYTIHVYDSCSSDSTVEFIKSHYPQVAVTQLHENLGYRRGNALAMAQTDTDYIVVCNDDVEVEPDWLEELVRCLDGDVSIGMATPLILLADAPNRVNSAGNTLHFSGMYGPRGKGEDRTLHSTECDLAAPSGCCFIVRRAILQNIEGFSSDFDAFDTGWHASYEDVDLAWRIQLLGYRIRYVPSSVMYHHYTQPGIFPSRFGSLEWGRYITVLRNYRRFTLICLLPLLFIIECLMWVYAIGRGRPYLRAKAAVMRWLITNPESIREMRQKVQRNARVSDSQIMSRMSRTIHVDRQLGGSTVGRVLDTLLAAVMTAYGFVLLYLLRLFGL